MKSRKKKETDRQAMGYYTDKMGKFKLFTILNIIKVYKTGKSGYRKSIILIYIYFYYVQFLPERKF